NPVFLYIPQPFAFVPFEAGEVWLRDIHKVPLPSGRKRLDSSFVRSAHELSGRRGVDKDQVDKIVYTNVSTVNGCE
ncbi:MAG: hypothetical protein QMD99_22860, partial [Rhizobiaceae bacterium]|nr:hypothetical protein [Rhizobiaceae bacterium]